MVGSTRRNFIYSGAEIDQGIEHYSALCAQQPACRTRTKNSLRACSTRRQTCPSSGSPCRSSRATPWSGLPRAHRGDLGGFATLRADDPRLVDLRRAGDPSGLWLLSTMANLTLPTSFTWGELPASGWPTLAVERYFSSAADRGSIIGNPSEFLWGQEPRARLAGQPGENQYTSVQNSSVPTLLIGGTLDFETPAQNATRSCCRTFPTGISHLVRARPRGRLRVLRAERQHAAADHVLRHRPGRHVPLHPERGQLRHIAHADSTDSDCQGHSWFMIGFACWQ